MITRMHTHTHTHTHTSYLQFPFSSLLPPLHFPTLHGQLPPPPTYTGHHCLVQLSLYPIVRIEAQINELKHLAKVAINVVL